jgi:hypothetical protein
MQAHGDLFSWGDRSVVLFVEGFEQTWTLSRGWRSGDRLIDIRRWRFDSPRRVVGQMRRLVFEATDDRQTADKIAEDLKAWLGQT